MAAAHDATSDRWSAHPWRARGVRLLAYGLPIAMSFGFVHVVTSVTSTPTGSLWVFLCWWLAVSLAATAVVSLVYALTRRLLPLGALFELSLVFPDQAPSRFHLAFRTGTVESLEERTRLMREAKKAPTTQQAAEILLRLVAQLSYHDHVTAGHAERVRAYSYALGKQLGLPRDELDRLNWAALLHDIGKLEVSQEILNKPAPPTDEEWESLRRHPLDGETLVASLRPWLGEWVEAVGHHHERWDGTGYPRGLAGEAISRAGRIVAIADVYDVITSSRSYKEPASVADARAELVRSSGTQFDPRLVRAFLAISLGRMRLVVGPLSWLAHAPLLARIPLTQSVGVAVGGAAAVVATTATLMAGPADAPQAAVLRAARPTGLSAKTDVVQRANRPTVGRTDEAPPKPRRGPRPEREPKPIPTSPDDPVSPAATPPEPNGPDAPPPGPPADPNPPPAPAPPGPAPSAPTPAPAPPAPPAPAPPAPPAPPVPPPPPPPAPPPPRPNQPPSFVAGGSQSVLEDAGAQMVAGWATAISAGPASESSQVVGFTVATDNPGLFASQPSVAADGTLAYTPAANANGSATVSVVARDDAGTAGGGVDSSGAATFAIAIQAVNDAPTCSIGGNQTALSLLGAQSVSGFASATPGPANESGQQTTFVVTTDRPNLFVVQPSISPDGTLTYRPRLLGLGVATVTVRVVDDGGTANGGTDTSAPSAFTITII